MLDINELDGDIITAICSNKEWPDDDSSYCRIEAMTVYEAFNSYLEWNGIIGSTGTFMRVLDNIKKAKESHDRQSA